MLDLSIICSLGRSLVEFWGWEGLRDSLCVVRSGSEHPGGFQGSDDDDGWIRDGREP